MVVRQMIRVSQSKASGKIVSRRPVSTRITRAGYLWASLRDGEKEEQYWRDPHGVWWLKRPSGARDSQFTVWLEEK